MTTDKLGVLKIVGSTLAILLPILAGYYQFVLSDGAKRDIEIREQWSYSSLSFVDDLDSRVEVKIDGKEINNLYIARYSIENVGAKMILKEDFDQPLQIEIDEPWEIVGVTTDFSRPKTANLNWVRINEKIYELEKTLINPKDNYEISVYATNTKYDSKAKEQEKPQFTWPHRIKNLHEINIIERNNERTRYWIEIYFKNSGVWLFLFIAMILATITSYLIYLNTRTSVAELSRILMMVGSGGLSLTSATIITGNILGENMGRYNQAEVWLACGTHFVLISILSVLYISRRNSEQL